MHWRAAHGAEQADQAEYSEQQSEKKKRDVGQESMRSGWFGRGTLCHNRAKTRTATNFLVAVPVYPSTTNQCFGTGDCVAISRAKPDAAIDPHCQPTVRRTGSGTDDVEHETTTSCPFA